MFTLIALFVAGAVIGVVYEKQLRKYKDKLEAAAKAAKDSFRK
jgi:hypothetical protein